MSHVPAEGAASGTHLGLLQVGDAIEGGSWRQAGQVAGNSMGP